MRTIRTKPPAAPRHEPESEEEQARRQARQPPPRDIGPNRETPREAVEAAAAIIAAHGITSAIRAFDIALREADTPEAADVAELTRLTRMRRRAQP